MASKLIFFQISGIFRPVLVVFLLANATNKKTVEI